MILAIVNSVRREAEQTGERGICSNCQEQVISKCGNIRINHWAHSNNPCDSWDSTPSFWKLEWMKLFEISSREVVITNGEKRRFADVYKNGRTILFQGISISQKLIQEKEKFFGNRMIWILDGRYLNERFELGQNGQEKQKIDELVLQRKYLNTDYIVENGHFFWIATGNRFYEIDRSLHSFQWRRPKNVWTFSQQPVFIDLGNQFVYLIIKGLGTSSGECKQLDKREFLNKYIYK